MKKKVNRLILFVFVVMTMVLCCTFSSAAYEESGQCGVDVYWTYDYSTNELRISGNGDMFDYDAVYEEEEDSWCREPSPFSEYYVESVVIEDGVTRIGSYAFRDFEYLKDITMADSVTSIGMSAFSNCESLLNVTLSEGLEKIEGYAFCFCTSLTNIRIPDSVKTVDYQVFEGCVNLESVDIGAGLENISYHMFYACSKLKNITVDENSANFSTDQYGVLFNKDKTKLILYPAGNEGVSYAIPDGVVIIDREAFSRNKKLIDVRIPSSLRTMGSYAFSGCSNLSKLTINKGATDIGFRAFEGCSNLVSVVIPNSVTKIGDFAFGCCSKLKSITIPGSVNEVGYYAFESCKALESVKINGATTICGFAFRNCTALKTLTLVKGIKSIERYAFYGCTNLTSVEIPNGVTNLGEYVFSDCSKLKSVTVPGSVSRIGERAFNNCAALESVKIGEGVKTIGSSAFETCNSLKNIFFPVSLQKVESYAFAFCYNIFNIYYAGTQQQWLKIKFNAYNGSLENAQLYYKFSGQVPLASATQSASAVKLTWSPVSGAVRYRVYQKNGNSWKTIGETSQTTLTVKKLASGTKYTFAVKAAKKSGNKIVWSSAYNIVKTATKAAVPTKVTATQTTSSIKLTWKASVGATGYRIYYKNGNKWTVIVNSTSATSYTVKNLKAGTKYTFAIKPFMYVEGSTLWSNYATYTATTTPAKVTAKVSSPAKGKITLTWNAVNGAESYRVYYKKDNGSYKFYKAYSKVKTLTFSNLNQNSTFTFAVRAGISTSDGVIYGGYNAASIKADATNSQIMTTAKAVKLWKEAYDVYYLWGSWGIFNKIDKNRGIYFDGSRFEYYPVVHPTIKTKSQLKTHLLKYFDDAICQSVLNRFKEYKGAMYICYPTGKGVYPEFESVVLKGQAGDYAEVYVNFVYTRDGSRVTNIQKMRYVNGKWIFVEKFYDTYK